MSWGRRATFWCCPPTPGVLTLQAWQGLQSTLTLSSLRTTNESTAWWPTATLSLRAQPKRPSNIPWPSSGFISHLCISWTLSTSNTVEECCTCQQTIHWTCQPIVSCCLWRWLHKGTKYGSRNDPTTLVRSSHSASELASKHALNLAQAWLGWTGQYNTYYPMFTDLSAVDRFAIVTDHHNSSITKKAHLDQEPKNITYQKQWSTKWCCHKP